MSHLIDLVQIRLRERRRSLERLSLTLSDQERAFERGDDAGSASALEAAALLSRLSTQERFELQEVDAALARLERGTYGSCERCDGPIGLQRLAALPEARFCMGCSTTPASAN